MSRSQRLGVAAALVDGAMVPGDVSIADGVVEQVGHPPGDGARGVAVPGFVDWQVNGFGGVHFTGADAGAMGEAASALVRAGIVFAAPTFLSTDLAGYRRSLDELGGILAADPTCGLTAAHLEGPFLSRAFAGAHDPSTFVAADPGLMRSLLDAGPVAMVTLAPELDGSADVIAALVERGVTVSIGHSDADAAAARFAQRCGATAITHCWNGHRRFAPRDPGPAGWALDTPGVTVGLVADGVHVAPEVVALTFAVAPRRVAVTTDAIAPAGTDLEHWNGGGFHVEVAEGAARLADGTLAGSVATPTRMLRELERAGVDFADAVHAMSAPQAQALGLGQWAVRPGDPAHVTVLADDHEVLATWRNGVRL